MYDVAIAGGGPAGLNAALMLGRARRRTLVCDSGRPRNSVSHAMHGFLSRDRTDPAEMRRLGRQELERYDTVEVRNGEVTEAVRGEDGFALALAGGGQVTARRLLLATGMLDELPSIDGLAELWGRGTYPCRTATAGRCVTRRCSRSALGWRACSSGCCSQSGAVT
jgi:thioredoxin reductase